MNANIDLHVMAEDAIRVKVGPNDPTIKWISVGGRAHLFLAPKSVEALRDACSDLLQMYEDEATPHGMTRVGEPLAVELERLTAEQAGLLPPKRRTGTHG